MMAAIYNRIYTMPWSEALPEPRIVPILCYFDIEQHTQKHKPGNNRNLVEQAYAYITVTIPRINGSRNQVGTDSSILELIHAFDDLILVFVYCQ